MEPTQLQRLSSDMPAVGSPLPPRQAAQEVFAGRKVSDVLPLADCLDAVALDDDQAHVGAFRFWRRVIAGRARDTLVQYVSIAIRTLWHSRLRGATVPGFQCVHGVASERASRTATALAS